MVELKHFMFLLLVYGIDGTKVSKDDISHLARLLRGNVLIRPKAEVSRALHVSSDSRHVDKEFYLDQLKQLKDLLQQNEAAGKRWIEDDSSIRATSPRATHHDTYPPTTTTTTTTTTSQQSQQTWPPSRWSDYWRKILENIGNPLR